MVGTGRRDIQSDEMLILASVWASNSRFQRHINGPEKARNVYPTVQKSMKTSPNVFYKESMHIRDVDKKIDLSAENCVLITRENGLRVTFSRKHTSTLFWPGDIALVLLCI
jgi:hypothetical protein